ncbi:MAG TPA: hypothetical protein VGS19_15545 [Streptosporangiaceae bacterium]|nr:hypothetical protein [Streptosporangiaceae bacterium]
MHPRQVECPAEVTLTPDETGQLAPIPEPFFALQAQLRCELQAAHDGPHLALAQASGSEGWWMRWADGLRDLAVIHGLCPAEQGGGADGDDDYGEACSLPSGHAGCHSFEMADDTGAKVGAWRLRPCPVWCSGEHVLPDLPLDGFHHSSPAAAISLTHSQRADQTEVLTAALVAFVPAVAGSPWPARVEVSVDKNLAFELTPAEARQLAAILHDLSSRADADPAETSRPPGRSCLLHDTRHEHLATANLSV